MFKITEFSNERIKVEKVVPLKCDLEGCKNQPAIKLSFDIQGKMNPLSLYFCEECLLELMTFLRRADDELNAEEEYPTPCKGKS